MLERIGFCFGRWVLVWEGMNSVYDSVFDKPSAMDAHPNDVDLDNWFESKFISRPWLLGCVWW